jgi:hypothetical protein
MARERENKFTMERVRLGFVGWVGGIFLALEV